MNKQAKSRADHAGESRPGPSRAGVSRRGAVVGVVLILALATGIGWWVRTNTEPKRDYLAEYRALHLRVAGVTSPEQSRWEQWEAMHAAFEAAHADVPGGTFVDTDGSTKPADLISPALDALGPTGAPAGPEAERARALIAAMDARGVFSALDALAGAPNVRPAQPTVDGSISTHPAYARRLTRVLSFMLVDAARAGDAGGVRSAARRIGIVAAPILREPAFVARLTGGAVLATGMGALRAEAAAGALDASTLRATQAAVTGWSPPRIEEAIEGERLFGRASLERWPGRIPVIDSRARAARLLDAMFDAALAHAREPDDAALKAAFDTAVADAAANRLASYVLPGTSSVLRAERQFQTRRAGTILTLAIEEHLRTHGEPPATLEAIDPAILAERPVDPATGKPFGYRVLATPDADGRRYVLYAFGADGADDAGAVHPKGNEWALRANDGKGFDFVFNEPRRVVPARTPAE